MTKKDLLLQKIEEQKAELFAENLYNQKEKFAESLVTAIKMSDEQELTDAQIDILLKDKNILKTLFFNAINWYLDSEPVSNAYQNMSGYLSDVRYKRIKQNDEEM